MTATADFAPRPESGKAVVLLAHFPGGNTIHPKAARWFYETKSWCEQDERIGKVGEVYLNDTPITMTRNRVLRQALEQGVDYLLMLDNDMMPQDDYPGARSFFPTAFDFLWNNEAPACIAAPYVGPPPHNNIYVFRWRNTNNYQENSYRLEQYTREEAYERGGIEKVAALPTGVILYDLRMFKLKPDGDGPGLPPLEGQGWFYYEWTDELYADHKASTEDVTQTRDASLWWSQVPGAGVYCAWDSWFYHYKTGEFGRPQCITADDVGERFFKAKGRKLRRDLRTTVLNPIAEPVVEHQEDDGIGQVSLGSMGSGDDRRAIRELARSRLSIASHFREEFNIVEVGSWVGQSALELWAGAGSDHTTLTCVDTWQGSTSDATSKLLHKFGRDTVKDAFYKNLSVIPTGVLSVWESKSTVAAKELACRGRWIDLLHIDAEHTYEAVVSDVEAWIGQVRDAGTIIFHDYRSNGFPGVTRALDDLFGGYVKQAFIEGRPTVVGYVVISPNVIAEFFTRKAERDQRACPTPEPPANDEPALATPKTASETKPNGPLS